MLNMLSNHVDIDKLRRDITETGLKAMNEIINAVAPPISEHEVIQVNLSHDMLGYEGVETLVYRALAKVSFQGATASGCPDAHMHYLLFDCRSWSKSTEATLW